MYLTKELGKRSKGSDKTYYAAVEELCTNYIVQFGAPQNIFSSSCTILKAKLFIDGQWDHTCMQLQKSRVKAIQVLESTGIGMGIKISTGFEKSQNVKLASNKILSSISTIPVAVLHIHYRPESWLRARNILIDDIPVKSEIGIEDEFKNIKNESSIKQEFEDIKYANNNDGCQNLVKREFASIEERKHEGKADDGINSDVMKKRFKEDAKSEKEDYLRNELKQYKTLTVAKRDIDVTLLKQRRLERESGVKNKTLLKLKR
ncbi:6492_t:CDS:2 [Funneliformis geosporum]|uniref:7103_t:CDS:1 n=1 Tax=Funneliformis geosporum TaxID=1117311 RepID=A0A9W4SQV1_9GLOM|nr:6492_t:CDS:2 [Funneliformis geosporum]CAI2177171.1 7103_t:CDS:2 [Funneliformis geosporum]